jgi:predicted lipoprotein with Yx(FWY)xxD motif
MIAITMAKMPFVMMTAVAPIMKMRSMKTRSTVMRSSGMSLYVFDKRDEE